MKTRNAGTPKSPPAKKTPPTRKHASKTAPTPPPESVVNESTTPKITDTKATSVFKEKPVKTVEVAPVAAVVTDSKPNQPVEQAKTKPNVPEVTPATKVASGVKTAAGAKTGTRTKTIKRVVVRRVLKKKSPASAKTAATKQTLQSQETEKAKDVETSMEEKAENDNGRKSIPSMEESVKNEESTVKEAEETEKDGQGKDLVLDDPPEDPGEVKEVNKPEEVQPVVSVVGGSSGQEEPVAVGALEVSVNQEPTADETEKEEATGEMEVEEEPEDDLAPDGNTQGGVDEELEGEGAEELEGEDAGELEGEDALPGDEEMIDDGAEEVVEEFEEEVLAGDDANEHNEAVALEAERVEINAAAKERKLRKQLEIFVGGLDRDAAEDDVKKAFGNVGEVAGVRFYKNKGYAFVKFATKEQATRALAEMKNPVVISLSW